MINIAYRPAKGIAAALIATTCLLPASPLAAQEAAPEKIDLTVLALWASSLLLYGNPS